MPKNISESFLSPQGTFVDPVEKLDSVVDFAFPPLIEAQKAAIGFDVHLLPNNPREMGKQRDFECREGYVPQRTSPTRENTANSHRQVVLRNPGLHPNPKRRTLESS